MTTINFSLEKPERLESNYVKISSKKEMKNESDRQKQKQSLNFSVQSKESTSKNCSPQRPKSTYIDKKTEFKSKGKKNKKMEESKNTPKKRQVTCQ